MKTRIIHPGNFECFMEVYAEKLKQCRAQYPEMYSWPESEMETVINRMRQAVERGTFNKDSHAFKATCKALQIPYTYKGIDSFILTGEFKC